MYRFDFAQVLVDDQLNIINTNSFLYYLTNDSRIKNLIQCFSSEDCKEILNLISKQNGQILATISVHFHTKVIVEFYKKSNDLAEILIYDALKLPDVLFKSEKKVNAYSSILSNFEIEYFLYNPEDNMIKYYNLTGLHVDLSYNQFVNYINKRKNIQIKDEALFQNYLNNCKARRIFAANNTDREIKIMVSPFYSAYDKEIVIGVFIYNHLSDAIVNEKMIDDDLDGLTKLKNKTYMEKYLSNRVDICKNHTTLMILDIDYFKDINDNYGHKYGDEILCKVARIIERTIGYNGMAGRFGGDEFLIVLNTIDTDEVKNIARNVRMGIQWITAGSKDEGLITCSIGIARFPNDVRNSMDLFKLADKCLYIAKNKGKNRYIIYTPEIHGDLLNEKRIYSEAQTQENVLTDDNFDIIDQCYAENVELEDILKKLFDIGKFGRTLVYIDDFSNPRYAYGDLSGNLDGNYIIDDDYKELFAKKDYFSVDNTSSLLTTYKNQVIIFTNNNIKAFFQYVFKDEQGNVIGAISLENLYKPRTFKSEEILFYVLICRLIAKNLKKNKKI